MANYNSLKNAGVLAPAANTDLGTDTNRYANVFMSGNINMSGTSLSVNNIQSPKISSIGYLGDDTATDPAGGQTITLNGTGLQSGASVLIGSAVVSSVSFVNSTQLTFVSPALSAGSYVLYVVNPDGGTATYVIGIQYSGVPTWSTSAGSLGTVVSAASIDISVAATGDAPVTYSVFSGSLPSGLSLNSTTGAITGTAPSVANTTYNFTIRATDAQNQDTDRAFSIQVITNIVGQQAYTTAGTYSWTAPAGVTSVSVVAVGGGGSGRWGSGSIVGGAGGGLGWKNNISVTPGQSYTVVVGAGGDGWGSGAASHFINQSTVAGLGGAGGTARGSFNAGGSYVGDGGGTGGNSGTPDASGGTSTGTGGGGAGGYSGNGGTGRSDNTVGAGGSGSGGGGGGGGALLSPAARGGAGGGVGILGQGANGAGETYDGFPGSGGSDQTYGGGGSAGSGTFVYTPGGSGAVRIIWGAGRAFPSTLTADQS